MRNGGRRAGTTARHGSAEYRGPVEPHRLDRTEARRIAIRAQLLDDPRPTETARLVRQLNLLQVDPTAAIAPNADLVAWSRLGRRTGRADLVRALEQDRTLYEVDALIRPIEDLELIGPTWRHGRSGSGRVTGSSRTSPSAATS